MKATQFNPSMIPISVHSDSYKFSHPQMYEPAEEMSAYIEARSSFKKGTDQRIIHYGTQYFMERWLMRQWTMQDVNETSEFFSTFNAGGTAYPFPEDLFKRIVTEYNGWFPIKVEALPDGSVIYPRTPQLTLTAYGDFSRLVTWMETTALQTIWYMSTVATSSRRVMETITKVFDATVDLDAYWKLSSRFHDFGFRGTTSTEQAIMGGAAHLLNSDGTDTSAAAYYVQYHLNKGKPVGSSIPATEHSVMTSFPTELEAVNKVVKEFKNGVFATVADSYDYTAFLNELVPKVVKAVKEAGGFHVVRPDSGSPIDCVLEGLWALERAYGSTTNNKGFRIINNAGVIQGDGINSDTVIDILDEVMLAGFSAENVAFGMGAGLLQKVNRDTLSYACKLSYIKDENGERDIMKIPKTDIGKSSLPGKFAVHPRHNQAPYVMPRSEWVNAGMLKVIYDHGPVGYEFETFDQVRQRTNDQWNKFSMHGQALDSSLIGKINNQIENRKKE